MRKYVWLIGILIIAMLAMTFVAGCGKKQQSSSVATAPGQAPPPGAPPGAPPAAAGINTLADLQKAMTGLSSYVMTMDMGGMKIRTAVKLDGGKPVAMKSDTGQGWSIMRMDKKVMYSYSPATKAVMQMPMPASAGGASSGGAPSALSIADQLKAMAGAKVSSEAVDGVDCLKVVDGQNTYWCEKQHGLPVQMDMGGKTMKFKYEQVNAVPDSEFEVPAGLKIQQMPSTPK